MFTAASTATVVVISGVTAEESQFTILSFPPLTCDEKESGFYNSILPGTATYFMAITMLATIGWVIHKVYLECRVHHVVFNGNGLIAYILFPFNCVCFLQQKAHAAEVKLGIYFAYYSIFVLAILCQHTVKIAWRESFINATNSYFLCEAVGHVPGRCSRETLEQYSYPLSVLDCVYRIMAVFVPMVNLVFVIKLRNLSARVRTLKVPKFWTKSSQLR